MERLFIHPENQTLLWKLIQTTKHWSEFSRVSKQPPETWFRQCMERQYRRIAVLNPTPELSKNEWLLMQNKEFLRIATADISSVISPNVATPVVRPGTIVGTIPPEKMYSTVEESPTLVYSSSRNYDIPPISAFDMEQERKAKFEKAKQDFEQYQSQYNRLLQPLTPPAPDFSENAAQSKIANMEELLLIQQKMRDTDFDMFSPPPPPDRENIRKEVVDDIAKNSGRDNSAMFIPMNTEGNLREHESDKKSVSWSPAIFTP